MADLVGRAAELAARYRTEVFGLDLADLSRRLAPAASPLRWLWALCTDAAVRAGRRQIRELALQAPGRRALLADVREASELAAAWSRAGGSRPVAWKGAALLAEQLAAVERDLTRLASLF